MSCIRYTNFEQAAKSRSLVLTAGYSADMGDDEPQYKADYLDGEEGESYNWAKRPGKVRVTYANGSTFDGEFHQCNQSYRVCIVSS
jgi:hypothetical protein